MADHTSDDDMPLDRCGDPNCDGSHLRTFGELKEDMMQKILKHGHQITGVFGDQPEDYISYSAGRCVLDKPELITTGPLPLEVSGFMINEAAKLMDDDDLSVEDGYEFPPDTLIANYPIKVVRVDPQRYPLNSIWVLFGEDPSITVLQLVWPDMHGCFPDDPNYTGPAQPIHPLERTAP